MNRIYQFFILLGIIGICFVILFGIAGVYVLNLGFLLFLFRKREYDEREKQLSRTAFSNALGIVMIILVNIYVLSRFIDFGRFLEQNWVGLLISFAFIILGVSGLITFQKN